METVLNRASRQKAAAEEITKLRSDVAKYAAFLDQPADRFLDHQFISYTTGISPERVRELLDGALPDVEPDDKEELEAFQKALFQQRLRFLRATRLAPSGAEAEAPYTLNDIEQGTGITKQQVSYLLNGKRAANAAHASRLERFFDRASQQRTPSTRLPQGFCLRNEGAALIAHLHQMVSSHLPRLALATLAGDRSTTSLAFRTSHDANDIDLVKLLPVLDQLRAEARERDTGGG
ncbi:hypothetical protein ABZ915_43275 [Streptomyces sp. NPDC046915]|uniref:hypothetical protein n=1 Tax=Streptomyces sp. NPDC046915 TaxID=3155257 RepID=UPI0033CA8771